MKSYLKVGLVLWAAGLLLSGCGAKVAHERPVPVVHGNVMLRVYVVRHGEAYRNVPHPADTPQEKLDSLTPKGLRQAAAAGKFLADKEVAAVIASPTGRTRQTAAAIVEALGLKERYSTDKSFASITQGKTPEGEPVSWSWRQEQWAAGGDPRPVGGESLADAVVRAMDGIERLADTYPSRAVAIVTHGEICAGLLGEAAETPMTERYKLHNVPTGSVSELVITDAGWFLLREGVTP